MSEKEQIQSTKQQVAEIIEHARGVIKGAVSDFLKDIEDAKRMVERANAIAHQWNEEALTLALPEKFRVDCNGRLIDLIKSLKSVDIYTLQGSLKGKPATAKDTEPTWIIPPRQKRVA